MTEEHTPPIGSEQEYQAVKGDISRRKRPAKVLRILMNAMEAYRQSRKYGWSRPWNKYGLTNFQSFRLTWPRDVGLLELLQQVLDERFVDMPDEARHFCTELLQGREELLGFVFVHELEEPNGSRFEGVTLSLGRINAKRYRDRLDLILESPLQDGYSTGLGRIRLYVDPYQEERKEPLWQRALQGSNLGTGAAQRLFAELADASWQWAEQPERLWDHWTSAYIDYFGPRQWGMTHSYFFLPGAAAEARLVDGTHDEVLQSTGSEG